VSAEVPYVVTVLVSGYREVIVEAVTAAEAQEKAEALSGVIQVMCVELQQ
jgi:hypothetical protein